jgi:hypothetical protein
MKGSYVRTEEHRKRMALRKMGTASPKKGKSYEELFGADRAGQIKKKIADGHADCSGENNPSWRETLLTVRGIHVRIIALYGKADRCENPSCSKKSMKYDWSHKTHQYSLDRSEWQRLCKSCHKLYDFHQGINGKGKIK